MVAGRRHNWFLTEVLLPAAITTANTAAWPPQGLQPCNILQHTNCNIQTHTSLLSGSGRQGRRRVQLRAQPLRQSHEASWPATDTHSFTHRHTHPHLHPWLLHTHTHTHSAGKERREPKRGTKRRKRGGFTSKMCQVHLKETAKQTYDRDC